MIHTAYRLPFTVTLPTRAFFSSGEDVLLIVSLRDGKASAGCRERVAEALSVFTQLVNLGALAGNKIEPWHSGANIQSVASAPDELALLFERCLFDDAGLIVLCDVLLHEKVAPLVKSLTVQMAGAAYQPLAAGTHSFSTYPARFKNLPFPILDEHPESGTYAFTLNLTSSLDGSLRETLERSLTAWSACVIAGGFALSPIPPSDNYVESEPLIEYDSTIEWAAMRLRAHPAAIDAVINIFAAFHAKHRQLVELIISS